MSAKSIASETNLSRLQFSSHSCRVQRSHSSRIDPVNDKSMCATSQLASLRRRSKENVPKPFKINYENFDKAFRSRYVKDGFTSRVLWIGESFDEHPPDSITRGTRLTLLISASTPCSSNHSTTSNLPAFAAICRLVCLEEGSVLRKEASGSDELG